MCGTNGLFVGCPALAFCPLSGAEASDCEADGVYASPFAKWHERAAVRNAPRREVRETFSPLESFPDALVPALNHPVTDTLDKRRRGVLKTQQLYRYLDFTTRLEHLVVNRTALGIAHGTIRVDVPDSMRLDALYIYVDEAYHAVLSEDLARQVRRRTGIPPNLPATPAFMVALNEIMSGHPGYERLIELLFVIVSETLITGNLAGVARAGEIDGAVAQSVADHAMDEGRHHAYFRQFLTILWRQLSRREREVASDVYPRLVVAFTVPERAATIRDLVGVGVDAGDAVDAVDQLFNEVAVRDSALRGAARSLEYFTELKERDFARLVVEQVEVAQNERTRP